MSKTNEIYKGWSSYETWLVINTWEGDEVAHSLLRSIAKSRVDKVFRESVVYDNQGIIDLCRKGMVEDLSDWIERTAPPGILNNTSIHSTLFRRGLQKVNVEEIATAYLANAIQDLVTAGHLLYIGEG